MEPASIRYKNPGAMWPGATATKWGSKRWVYLNDGTGQGGNGKGNKIAIFDNWADGVCAQIDLWRGPRYHDKPFAAAIAVWSGGNHVESYIKFVLDRVPGMKRDTPITDAFLNSPMGIGFLKAQAWHEAGKKLPIPDADFFAAQKRVFGGKQPATSVAKKTVVASVSGIGSGTAAATEGGLSPGYALLIGVAVALAILGVWIWRGQKHEPVAALPAPETQDEHEVAIGTPVDADPAPAPASTIPAADPVTGE